MNGPVEDPGWGPAAKGLVFPFVPMLGARRAMSGTNGLIVMRQAWCAFVGGITVVGVVVVVLRLSGGFEAAIDGSTAALAVAVIGVLAQLFASRGLPPLTGDNERAVATRFQRSFFLRIALAEAPALVGFVAFILSGNAAVYFVGYTISAFGLVRCAPTAARLEATQQRLEASGSGVNLLAALVGSGITR